MPQRIRVEWTMDWGDGTTREVVYDLIPKPQPGEAAGRLWFAVNTTEEAEEIIALVERSRRSKLAADRVKIPPAKGKKKARTTEPPEEAPAPPQEEPAPEEPKLPEEAPAPKPDEAPAKVPDEASAPPAQTDLEQHIAAKKPNLTAVPKAQAAAPAKDEVDDLVKYVIATAGGLPKLAESSIKDVLVMLREGGVKDPQMMVAVCQALQSQMAKTRLSKIVNVEDRVARVLVQLNAEAASAAAKGA